MNEADHAKRVVMPQWLPFTQASTQREANTFSGRHALVDFTPTQQAFAEALDEFHAAPSAYIAIELMGIAQVLGQSSLAREMAEYVLAQKFLSSVVHTQAQVILGRLAPIPESTHALQVRQTKRRVRDFPLDAIAWLEQARLYTILGNYNKGRRSILAALQLAPGDRLVTRCAIRFFVHFDKWDEALAIAQRAHGINPDPLIFGPLLSVASRVGKLPTKVKTAVKTAVEAQDSFLHSETLEAFGTMELMAGAGQKAKPFFRQAWSDPAHAVIGHSQWILREHLPTLAHEQRINFWTSKEAVSWLRFSTLDFESTVTDANEWALEEPFSRSPHILGSMAACIVGDFAGAARTAERGLMANPKDEILLNNLAFALLREGHVQRAEEVFSPLIHRLSDKSQIATVATYGLLHMSKGDVAGGSKHYAEAISRALEKGDRRNAVRATLNYLVSSLEIAKTIDPGLLKSTQQAIIELADPACLGVADFLAKKLQSSDLTGSDTLSIAAREFADSVAQTRKKFQDSIVSKLLAAAPKPAPQPLLGRASK